MANEDHPDHEDHNKPNPSPHDDHSSPKGDKPHEDDDSIDFKKMQDKYEKFKSNPNVKSTGRMLANYVAEFLYLGATVIAFVISLARKGNGGLIFIGIGFLIGLFLYPLVKSSTQKVSGFLSKQELVIHIIIAVILLILACIIPTIMIGVLIGIPSGFGVRGWLFDVKGNAKPK